MGHFMTQGQLMGPVFVSLFILGFNPSSETQGQSVGLGKRCDENIPRGSPAYAWKLSSRIFPNPTDYPWVSEDGFNFSTTLLFITLLLLLLFSLNRVFT